MLQAIDERLSIWGWQTGTGTKFAIVIDTWGKEGRSGSSMESSMVGGRGRGLGDGDVKVVSVPAYHQRRERARGRGAVQ